MGAPIDAALKKRIADCLCVTPMMKKCLSNFQTGRFDHSGTADYDVFVKWAIAWS